MRRSHFMSRGSGRNLDYLVYQEQSMYSYEAESRIRAVDLYNKLGKRARSTFRQRG